MADNDKPKMWPPAPEGRDDLLINQPFAIGGWSIVVAAVCRCASYQPIQLTVHSATDIGNAQPGALVVCPKCGKKWRLGPNTKIALDVQLVSMGDRPQS